MKSRFALRALFVLVLASVCLLGAELARAQPYDWPMWRGSRLRSGRSAGQAQMTEPAVRWSYYLGGSLDDISVLAADVDEDGETEIVMAPGGKVVAKDGVDGIEWDSLPLQISALEGLADLDGDGTPELVARSGQRAYVLDGHTGTVLWSYVYGGNVQSLTIMDVNGDGVTDLIVEGYTGVSCNREHRWFDFSAGGYAAPASFQIYATNLCNSLPFVVGDMDGNNDLEMMVDVYGTFRVLDPLTGATKAQNTLFSNHTYNTVWLADLAGNGTLQYVLISARGFAQRVLVQQYTGASLNNLWLREVGTNAAQTDVRDTRFLAESVVDLDGDGAMEIVVSTFNQLPEDDGRWRLLVLDAMTGTVLIEAMDLQWEGLVDLDGDGTQELLAIDAAGATITGLDFGDLGAYTYTSGSPNLTQRWSLPNAAVHHVVRRQHSRMSSYAMTTARQDLDGDNIDEVYVDREETGDAIPEALQAIQEVAGQPQVYAEYRPSQTLTRATIVGLGDDLTGPGRPAETLVSLSNGFLVGLDPLMATSAVLRTGGYNTFKVLAVDLQNTGQLAVVVVDSRGILQVLDPGQADLSQPPQTLWSYASQTQFYPLSWDLDGDSNAELVVADWDGSGKVVRVLEHDGSTKWSVSLGIGAQANDTLFKPANLVPGGNTDLYVSVYNNTTAKRNLLALDGDNGSTLWSTDERMGNNYLQDFPVYNVNSGADSLDDAVYSTGSGQFQIYSGADGSILYQANVGYERRAALMECDGDAELEVVLGTGPTFLRLLNLQASILWSYPSPLQYQFDNRDPAPVDADGTPGHDLAFGDKFGELRVVSGHNGVLYYSRWLHQGQALSADPGDALPLGNGVGADIDGDGLDEILIPSADGHLYALNAEDGSLLWAYNFRYPVAEPILADLDGDGQIEVIVASADGYLYALQSATLPAPAEVRDVELDASFQIQNPGTDIDASDHTSAAAAAWDAVTGALGYRVAMVSETGSVIVPWTDAGGTTEAVFTGLHLEAGRSYLFLVMAYGANMASSAQAQSDHFVVEDLTPPAVHDLEALPATLSPNGDALQDGLSILARLTDLTALSQVDIDISDGTVVRSFSYPISGTEHYLVQGWDGLDAGAQTVPDGIYVVTVTAHDEAGHSASDAINVVVDTAAPAPPVILDPANGARLNDDRPPISGTSESLATVTLYVDGQYFCVADADATGAWGCPSGAALAEGSHSVWAEATDGGGNTSAPSALVTFHVDTVAPSPPTILSPVGGEHLSTTTPDLTGTTAPQTTVTVYENDTPLCEVVVGQESDWACTSVALTPGYHTVTARAVDLADNASDPSEEVTFIIEGPALPDAGVTDAGTAVDGGTDLRGEGGGCSCQSTGAPPAGLLGLVLALGVLGWRRRRRRRACPRRPEHRAPLLLLCLATGLAACGPSVSESNNNNETVLPDSDQDCIPDSVEGRAEGLDTDGDGTPDWQDTDSDNDGIPDIEEGGGCAGGGQIDSDGDGTPDFQDTDSDNNGIDDADESTGDLDGNGVPDRIDPDDDGDGIPDTVEIGDPQSPLDTDGDGTPDFQDTDSDGDTILDLHEGLTDSDVNAPDPAERDGIPDYLDTDSDGDGISDADEAGDADPATRPVDTDGDGRPDFRDYDSDDDGLPDYFEEAVGTDRLRADSDGDGVSDLVELAAGTDPNDAGSTLPEGDFYFELPYEDPEGPKTGVLTFTTDVRSMDVVINMDTTSSMGGEIDNLRSTLSQTVGDIRQAVPDTSFGISRFEDFPLAPYGDPADGDQPFTLLQQVTQDASRVQTAVDSLFVRDGGDLPEASLEALYQLATGAGLTGPGATSVAPFVPDPLEGPGTLGGAGFNEGSLPVVLHVTDAAFHAPGAGPAARDCFDGYLDYGVGGTPDITGAHDYGETEAALVALGIRVVGLISREYPIETNCSPYDDLTSLALATGAAVPPEAFAGACGPGLCCTGIDGAGRSPIQGHCPLVFEIRNNGSGLGTHATNAILALATYGKLDVSSQLLGNSQGEHGEPLPPSTTTADFVQSIVALSATPPPGMPAPAIEDRDQDGTDDTFVQVTPGTGVRFSVTLYNDFVQPTTDVQLFVARIQVLGDQLTVLDERNVYIVVPPVIPVIPVE